MPNVRDHDASVYLRLQGDALSVGGYEPNPIFWEEVRLGGNGVGGAGWGCISAWRSLPPGSPRLQLLVGTEPRRPRPTGSDPPSLI